MGNARYATTLSGILKIVGVVLGFITMIIIAAVLPVGDSNYGYILFVSLYVWVMCLILLVLHMLELDGNRGMEIFEAVALGLMVLFVAIAFIIAAVIASYSHDSRSHKDTLITATVFFAVILVTSIVDLFFHLRQLL